MNRQSRQVQVVAALCTATFVFSPAIAAGDRTPKAVDKELDKLNEEVRRSRESSRQKFDAARRALQVTAPRLPDILDHLAEKFRQLEGQTSSKAKEVGERNEPMKEASEKLLDEQQKLDHRLGSVEKALQRDANAQNMTSKKGRERARDCDAGRELVRKPADASKEALEKGIETGNAAEQEKALEEAAQKQGKVAEALDLLAEHFRNLEAGDEKAIAQTRKKLRDAEEELGIKEDLDEQFGMIERLMDMAQKKPEDILEELEKDLKNDPAMQDELRNIADEAAENAKEDIGKTAEEQKDLANQLDPKGHLADTAREIAREDIPPIEDKAKLGKAEKKHHE